MRHTEHIIIGSDHYVVSAKVMKEVEAVLKKSRAKTVEQTAEGASALAHVLYPRIDDPVQGGALYLRGIRRREGLTQTALAEAVGMKQSHISEMERGCRPIGKAAAKKLAVVLNANWKSFL